MSETLTAEAIINIWNKFFRGYRHGDKFIYFEAIQNLNTRNMKTLYINYQHLDDMISIKSTDKDYLIIDKMISHKTEEARLTARTAALRILKEVNEDYALDIEKEFRVEFQNSVIPKSFTDISVSDMGTFVKTDGLVQEYDTEPRIVVWKTVWKCEDGHMTESEGHFKPRKCGERLCALRDLLRYDIKAEDYIRFRLQQRSDQTVDGRDPAEMEYETFGPDNVTRVTEFIRFGGYAVVDGIVKTRFGKYTSGAGLPIGERYIEACYFESIPESKLVTVDQTVLEKARHAIEAMSEDEFVDKMIRSVCPSLLIEPFLRKIILLLVVGSNFLEQEDGTRIRGELQVMLVGDPGCLAKGRIALSDGSMARIESLGSKHLQTIEKKVFTGSGKEIDTATCFHKYTKQYIIEVVTETGKSLKCTYNHPLSVQNQNNKPFQWVRADQLRIGDKIQCVSKINCYLKNNIPTGFKIDRNRFGPKYHYKIPEFVDEDLAGFLGYVIGDGYWHKYKIGLLVSATENELVEKIINLTDNIFGFKPSVYQRPLNSAIIEGKQIVRTVVMTEMSYHSVDLAQSMSFLREKRVPDLIFQSPNNVVASFLRWLFQADGTVFNNGRGRRAVALKSRKIELLRDVQLLLLRFGIHSRIVIDQLLIRRGYDIIEFFKYIGFSGNEKSKKLTQLAGDAENFKYRRQQRTERIVKLIRHEEPEDVYDIEVPITNRFVANGIVSHNTAKSHISQWIKMVRDRVIYNSGGKSTSVGLVGGFDSDTKRIKSGVFGMARNGIVILDEFADRPDADYQNLLEPLSDMQSVSIAKGMTYRDEVVNTGVLAVANPSTYSRYYDPDRNILENTKIPSTILQRFDAVIVRRDIADAKSDEAKARHFFNAQLKAITGGVRNYFDAAEMRAIIQILRETYGGYLATSQEACEVVIDWYNKRRKFKITINKEKGIKRADDPDNKMDIPAADMRRLGAIVRFSQANARLRRSNIVEKKDVEEAMMIVDMTLAEAGHHRLLEDGTKEYMLDSLTRHQQLQLERTKNRKRLWFEGYVDELTWIKCPPPLKSGDGGCGGSGNIPDISGGPAEPCQLCNAKGWINQEFDKSELLRRLGLGRLATKNPLMTGPEFELLWGEYTKNGSIIPKGPGSWENTTPRLLREPGLYKIPPPPDQTERDRLRERIGELNPGRKKMFDEMERER